MKTMVFSFLALTAATSFGIRTNTLEKGASDWCAADSYTDKSFVPGEGDVVLIAKNSTNYLYSTDSGSAEKVAKLGAIVFQGEGPSSSFVVDVAEGKEIGIGCPVYGETVRLFSTSWKNGEIVKTGGGNLNLLSIGKRPNGAGTDYYTNIRINDGLLRLPQTCTANTLEQYCQVGYVIVEEGATFVPARSDDLRYGQTYAKGLSGAGVVQGHTSAYWFIINDATPYGPFSGKVTGGMKTRVSAGGVLELTGVESDGFRKPYVHEIRGGTLGALKMGMKLANSSLGCTDAIHVMEEGGRFVYLGTGETSDRDFRVVSTANPFYLDGGASGGLVLTGMITNKADTTAPQKMRSMVFTGSNETACVFAGAIESSSLFLNGVNYALYMAKEGTGTWRFTDNPKRENANGYAVREGTLQFDSLLEAGLVCSLGVATNLTDGYAFNLGGNAASGAVNEPVFEYTGGTGVVCTTRPIALSGNAKIKNDTARSFRFRGVSGLGGGAKTLTLAGTNAGQNEIADISDGSDGGKVGVKKTGAGLWRISGDLTFTGDVSVEGGRLVIANPATNSYSWFRWTVKEINSATPTIAYCEEFGLFDNGNCRQNIGLSFVDYVSDVAPGEVAMEFPSGKYKFYASDSTTYPGTGRPDCMFNDRLDYGLTLTGGNFNGERENWLSFTMRLTNGAPEIATFDYVCAHAKDTGSAPYYPKTYVLEGSLNGLDWDEIYSTNSAASAYDKGWCWQSTGYVFSPSTSALHAGGFPIRGHALRDFEVLKNVGAVSVSGGGVLEVEGKMVEVRRVVVDVASGGGTLKNVKFADHDGELDVAWGGEGEVALPLTFTDCDGVENIAGWTLSVGGEPTRKKAVVRNGVVHIVAPGMTVVVR